MWVVPVSEVFDVQVVLPDLYPGQPKASEGAASAPRDGAASANARTMVRSFMMLPLVVPWQH